MHNNRDVEMAEEEPLEFSTAMVTIDKFIQNLYSFFETGEMEKEHRPFVD